jgi:hypothetical protein
MGMKGDKCVVSDIADKSIVHFNSHFNSLLTLPIIIPK